jgi:uncharacterized membrane protein YhhN
MNLKIFTTIYFTISMLEIIFGTIHFQMGVYFTKPIIMISIMLFYFYQTKNQRNFQDKLMLAAFFFSMLGDTFLMFKGEQYFMFGLGSFLITHLFYIFIFRLNNLKTNTLSRIFFFTFSMIMLFILKNYISSSFLIPIIIYMITITLMAITASERNTNPQSFRLVLIGAILFVLSDTLIAIDKFVVPIPFPTLLIMGTYVFAQYLIAVGFLKKNSTTL